LNNHPHHQQQRQNRPIKSNSEANSINGGGLKFFSESYGAALWTADFAFEAAKAGAAGVNLHWGRGG
jgi:hypothetical protein